jgi:putative flavoprotein involved in K+ transport
MTTTDQFDVIVIGGGQAGLAMAWHLAERGLRFTVLEAGPELGGSWRARWDSLRLFTRAGNDALPGMPFPGPADRYPTKDDVAGYLKAYAAAFDLPVRLNTPVTRLTRDGDGFEVVTEGAAYRARQVVVATGPFQTPFTPPAAAGFGPSVTQLHSSAYRNPDALPGGPVLVVGGGNSGYQIAAELAAGRQVQLAVGTRATTLPQRPLGKDLFWWLTRSGFMRVAATSRLGRRVRARGEFVIGSSLRGLRRAGVTVRPRLTGAEGRTAHFADGGTAEVGTVVWATGFRADHSWLDVPGVVEGELVRHRRGVTEVPGLYFLGLVWQHTRGSALLGFVQADAAYLADRIGHHAAAHPSRAEAGA